APVEATSQYYGVTRCSLCGNPARHCFELDIGDEVVVHCERCEAQNGLDASDATDKPCRECGALVHFPADSDEVVAACYQCLRAGNATLGKDTVLGMVGWEQANAGITHGAPGLDHPDFEMIPIPDDENAPIIP